MLHAVRLILAVLQLFCFKEALIKFPHEQSGHGAGEDPGLSPNTERKLS